MCRFIESIRVMNGCPRHLSYHLSRAAESLRAHGIEPDFNRLRSWFVLPEKLPPGLVKWRVVYGAEGVHSSTTAPYFSRKIERLRLIDGGDIVYSYKNEDRRRLNALFEKRDGADELVIVKNGYLTDAVYANVLLRDEAGWWTPANPLLAGTERAYLLDTGQVRTRYIRASEIFMYKEIALINAMVPFGEAGVLPVSPKTIL